MGTYKPQATVATTAYVRGEYVRVEMKRWNDPEPKVLQVQPSTGSSSIIPGIVHFLAKQAGLTSRYESLRSDGHHFWVAGTRIRYQHRKFETAQQVLDFVDEVAAFVRAVCSGLAESAQSSEVEV